MTWWRQTWAKIILNIYPRIKLSLQCMGYSTKALYHISLTWKILLKCSLIKLWNIYVFQHTNGRGLYAKCKRIPSSWEFQMYSRIYFRHLRDNISLTSAVIFRWNSAIFASSSAQKCVGTHVKTISRISSSWEEDRVIFFFKIPDSFNIE